MLPIFKVYHQKGKDAIEHPRGLHDDLANACAGCAVMLAKGSTIELTPEYMAARLPVMGGEGHQAFDPASEYEQQKYRVLKTLREKGKL